MQISEREVCGPEVSPSTVPEATLESLPFPTKSPAFDLFNLVLSYKRLEVYLEPLKDASDGVRYLLRWQTPLCSLLTCLGLNILFLTLNEGAWYSVGALMISVPALLGYLQEVCRARLPESELMRRKYHSVRQEDLQRVRLSRPEAIAELDPAGGPPEPPVLHLRSCLPRAALGEPHRVLTVLWGSSGHDLHAVSAASVLGPCPFKQHTLPGECGVLPRTSRQAVWRRRRRLSLTRSLKMRLRVCHARRSQSPVTKGQDWKELFPQEDDEGAPCPAEDELVLQDNGFLSKNEVLRSKVSRLTERLRKRYPTNNLGSCTGCSATFSVLKKRRNCSNCGNSFCSRCCSFKVPRSSMGATGAAATSDRALKSLGCGLSSPARRPYQHRGQHSDRLQDLGARRPTRPQALESAASASAPRTAPGPRSRRRQPTCSRSQQRQHPSSTGPAAGSERSAPPEHGH
ncbi:protrudin isoform X3 [Odocoileus virginianus]|uniref:Protrudin n=1 Tax=Odocoileus virginianus TaxID=9874 RepID=A0ABM4IE41_ODOVR